MSSRFLGWWTRIFGLLLMLVGAGCSVWSLSLSDMTIRVQLTLLTAICMLGGATLYLLGMACGQLTRLEDRVQALEQGRIPGPGRTPGPGAGLGGSTDAPRGV
jgi:hypothetical protein